MVRSWARNRSYPREKHNQVCEILPSMMQIQVGLEAFLAKPDIGPLDFRDCAQVINPFIITTKIDHCVEPTALQTYRQAPQSALEAKDPLTIRNDFMIGNEDPLEYCVYALLLSQLWMNSALVWSFQRAPYSSTLTPPLSRVLQVLETLLSSIDRGTKGMDVVMLCSLSKSIAEWCVNASNRTVFGHYPVMLGECRLTLVVASQACPASDADHFSHPYGDVQICETGDTQPCELHALQSDSPASNNHHQSPLCQGIACIRLDYK